ncbi:MAG TPA: efflux RND transporter periplasmic adaptor subunit [Bryobacteraceae bacterium]|jgi:RND family efflux transporter MFP subunit
MQSEELRRQPGETTEESLRRQNLELQRQLNELKSQLHGVPAPTRPTQYWRPSGTAIWAIFLGLIVLAVIAFFAGYLPLQARRDVIAGEAREEQRALPRVDVLRIGRSMQKSELELPGNIEPTTEAPILARADGYIAKRLVDIGDRVHAGQEVAEIEAPELDQQVAQAKATVQQMQAALEQADANLRQGKADTELARVTAQRTGALLKKGAVSRQEDDTNQAQYQAKVANLDSLAKAIQVQRSNLAAAQANAARLDNMQSYRVVRAPFDGVITLRNVDTGALVNAGNTLLYRIAQTSILRTYVNVPQAYADSVRPGEAATLRVTNVPGKDFPGTVARTANALDPSSRTLLVEVQVPNAQNLLMPGMYARVDLSSARKQPPLLVPSEALIVRADGSQLAVLTEDHRVHLQKIEIGRDFGDRIEVLGGLQEGALVVANPGDAIVEGQSVEPVLMEEKPHAKSGM